MSSTHTPTELRAAAAYVANYSGPWGLKASSEDALHAIMAELYPSTWANRGADGIYAIRGDERLTALATSLWEELECEGLDELAIARAIVPRLEELLGPAEPAAELTQDSVELIYALRREVGRALGIDDVMAYTHQTGGGCTVAAIDLSQDGRFMGRQLWLTREEAWVLGFYDFATVSDEGVTVTLNLTDPDSAGAVASAVAGIVERLGVELR